MKLSIEQLLAGCRRVLASWQPQAKCWRCEGHRCIEIYDISDEYSAPCPVCVGPDAYHAKIIAKNYGALPRALQWPPLPAGRQALEGLKDE